jgi:iron(III) transport system permease protein
LLLIPLAMPTYLAAYAYTDLLEYGGPVQSALRAAFGWTTRREYWFPEVRSLPGAITFMTLVLYPYVFLLARAAFLEQSASVLEVGRSLGYGSWRCFHAVALPLARPAIVVGVSLVLMETLNDFGTVDYFAVPTFTVAIFRVWFGMNNAVGAAQLASLLLGLVLLLIWMERAARRSRRFHVRGAGYRPLPGYRLAGGRAALAVAACLAPVLLGFVVPAGVLLVQSVLAGWRAGGEGLLGIMANSLLVSGLAAVTCVALGLLLAYGLRVRGSSLLRVAARIASIGYAVPGTVLAIGVVVPAAGLDNAVDAFMRSAFGVSTGLLLSGTVAALVFAFAVRFLLLAFATLEASLAKVTPAMDHAARSLGLTPAATLWRVHLPLLRGSLLTAGLLVFVDSMKELPMTLILRPFNFDTLSTHVYEYASYEQFHQAAPAALTIVAAGLLPVVLLSRSIARARPTGGGLAVRPHGKSTEDVEPRWVTTGGQP